MTLEELLDAELLGRLNQSGHLLMSLDQEPAGYNVVQEHAANRPPSIDWAHDLLHRIAQRMVDETHTAEQFGEPSTVRWGAHRAALEFREIGQLLCRLAELAMHNFRRPLSEPRTTPPINSIMHRHYRQWSHRWRGMVDQVVQGVFMHEDALDQQLRDDMQSREEHEQRLQQLRALEQLRVRPPSGPEAGLGVSVPRRPLGAQAGFKRTHDGVPVAVATSAGGTPSSRRPVANSSGVTSSGACSSSDAPSTMFGATTPRIPPRPKLRAPDRPVPPSPRMSPMPSPTLPPRVLTRTAPPPVQTRDVPSRTHPPAEGSGSSDDFMDDRYLIPSAPVGRPGIVTPFNERGQPCTPIIPTAPVYNSANPVTPLDVLELTTAGDETTDAILADILATPSSSTTTTATPVGVVFLSELLSSTSSTTTSTALLEDVDYDGEDVHVAVDEPTTDEVQVEVDDEETAIDDGDVHSPVEDGRGSEPVMSAGVDRGAGVGDFPGFHLSPRDERLAQHTASLVVAEVYHLLRTNGVIPGPGSLERVDVRSTPRTSRSTPPWRWTARLPRPRRAAGASGPYSTPSGPRGHRTRGLGSASLPSTTLTTTTTASTTVSTTTRAAVSTTCTLTSPWSSSLTWSSTWSEGALQSPMSVVAVPVGSWVDSSVSLCFVLVISTSSEWHALGCTSRWCLLRASECPE